MQLAFRHAGTPLSLLVLLIGVLIANMLTPVLFPILLALFLLFTALAIIPMLRGFRFSRLIRPGVYIWSYGIPIALGHSLLPLFGRWNVYTVALLGCTVVLPLLPRIRDLRASLDVEFVSFLSPITGEDLAVRLWYGYGGALGEELFYRGYLLWVLHPVIGWWSPLVTTSVFLWMHWFGAFRSEYGPRDYWSIGIMSLLSCVLTLYAGSLLPAMIAHLLFNTPAVMHYWLRYRNSTSDEPATVA